MSKVTFKRTLRVGGEVLDLDQEMYPYRKRPILVHAVCMDRPFEVETLEGTMQGGAGDWLIRGVAGELYPCKNDIFEQTYESTREHNVEDFYHD